MASPNKKIPVVIVVGMGKNTRAIGKNGELLWHKSDDLKRFKELTLGKPVIMGRKTFESIVKILNKPLPGRTNIVVTRDEKYSYPDAKITHSLEEALATAESENPTEIHIGGGSDLYSQALPYVDKIYITEYHVDDLGDVHFPKFEEDFTETKRHGLREQDGVEFEWVDYVRK